MMESILAQKAMDFAVMVVNLHKDLTRRQKEYEMSGQVKRSGTAIGALLCEAKFAESSADFVHKMKISLKECHETEYWLTLLQKTDYLSEEQCSELINANVELKKMLISSINTMHNNENNS